MTSPRLQAAALAKIRAPFLDPAGRAEKITRAVTPAMAKTISAAIAAELANVQAERRHQDRDDARLLAACKRVGEAVDLLDRAKFTAGERPARAALERACRQLNAEMQKGGRS